MCREFFTVVIEIDKDNSPNDRCITVPDKIYRQVRRELKTKLKVGMLEMDVEYRTGISENALIISDAVSEYLGLSQGMKTNIMVRHNNICLGPVIGAFVSNGQIEKTNSQYPNFRFIELMNANKKANTILYFFSIKDVDFANQKINGTYFNNETNQWERGYFPYPDVLYDRGGGTLNSQKAISDLIRHDIEKNKDLIKINSRYYFDKWDVYEKLSKTEYFWRYLPKTVLYNNPVDLLEMFNEFPVVYVKDCLGNNGIGVARVRKLSNDEYELSHFYKKTFVYNLASFDELIEKIDEIFNDKKLIIQNAIDLLQIDNRNIDMRATVQRNGNGELGVTAFPVRIGKADCPITSTRSGSSVYRIDDFLSKFFNYSQFEANKLKDRISAFLLTVFKSIEKEYGNFGEIGIDYALDKQWRIWFIECNAKPGKDTLYLSYDKETILNAFLNPLEYAKYLWED